MYALFNDATINDATINEIDHVLLMLSFVEFRKIVFFIKRDFCQIWSNVDHNKRYFYFLFFIFTFIFHFICFLQWFRSISLYFLRMIVETIILSKSLNTFESSNSSYIWIFTKLLFCFFILQIQRNQRLNVFSTMSSILLTMKSRQRDDENVL